MSVVLPLNLSEEWQQVGCATSVLCSATGNSADCWYMARQCPHRHKCCSTVSLSGHTHIWCTPVYGKPAVWAVLSAELGCSLEMLVSLCQHFDLVTCLLRPLQMWTTILSSMTLWADIFTAGTFIGPFDISSSLSNCSLDITYSFHQHLYAFVSLYSLLIWAFLLNRDTK